MALCAALAAAGRSPAEFVPYDALLANPEAFEALLTDRTTVRFDSPGNDRGQLAALLAAGEADCRAAEYLTLGADEARLTLSQTGRLIGPAQLWFGLRHAWRLAEQLAKSRSAKLLSTGEAMALTFDKPATCARLRTARLPTPKPIDAGATAESLFHAVRRGDRRRAFVKLRFGSGAAGMTALAFNGRDDVVAYTTVRLLDGALYNLRTPVRLSAAAEILALLAALLPHGVHVEEWAPKATAADGACDLRVLMVAGQPAHIAVRSSRYPMTNLHLGGLRTGPEALMARLGPKAWAQAMDSCQEVSRLFPTAFMLGVDLAFLADLRRHVIFEVNAFGDHLKDILHHGCDAHRWQIDRWDGWRPAA